MHVHRRRHNPDRHNQHTNTNANSLPLTNTPNPHAQPTHLHALCVVLESWVTLDQRLGHLVVLLVVLVVCWRGGGHKKGV